MDGARGWTLTVLGVSLLAQRAPRKASLDARSGSPANTVNLVGKGRKGK
jgi:hypothetical protein